jgi:Tfp pilus assembly protein PilO
MSHLLIAFVPILVFMVFIFLFIAILFFFLIKLKKSKSADSSETKIQQLLQTVQTQENELAQLGLRLKKMEDQIAQK